MVSFCCLTPHPMTRGVALKTGVGILIIPLIYVKSQKTVKVSNVGCASQGAFTFLL